MEQYADERIRQGKKPGTVHRDLATLGGALSLAVKLGWLLSKPQTPRIRVDDKRERFLSKAEAARLVRCAPHDYRPLLIAALLTGMRRGELLAMRWDWVDFKRRIISIPPESTKTNKGRHVPISDDLMSVLNRRRKECEEGVPHVLLQGTHWWIWDTFRTAVLKAELDGLRFHDLRHTAASWMVQAGVDLYRVAQILGHRSYQMTMRYAHLQPRHLQDAVEHLSFEFPQEKDPPVVVSGSKARQSTDNTREKG